MPAGARPSRSPSPVLRRATDMSIDIRPARKLTVVLAAFLVLVATPAIAWAFWTAGGAGAGVVTTGTLGQPTDVTASATGTTVTIAWTAPSTTPTGATLGYRVADNAGATVCGQTTPVSTTSCSY